MPKIAASALRVLRDGLRFCLGRGNWSLMCGRYSFHLSGEELAELTGSKPESGCAPVFNQSPGVPVPVLRPAQEWDLLPWGKEMSVGPDRRRLVINACSETAGEKRSFQKAFASRRCVLPASGFFEWHRRPERSQPFYFYPRSGPGILLGGLLLGGDDEEESCVVVLTKQADPWMEEVHHRAPVLVRPDFLEDWLDPALSGHEALRNGSFAGEESALIRHPVANRVSRVSENDAGILKEVAVERGAIQEELF